MSKRLFVLMGLLFLSGVGVMYFLRFSGYRIPDIGIAIATPQAASGAQPIQPVLTPGAIEILPSSGQQAEPQPSDRVCKDPTAPMADPPAIVDWSPGMYLCINWTGGRMNEMFSIDRTQRKPDQWNLLQLYAKRLYERAMQKGVNLGQATADQWQIALVGRLDYFMSQSTGDFVFPAIEEALAAVPPAPPPLVVEPQIPAAVELGPFVPSNPPAAQEILPTPIVQSEGEFSAPDLPDPAEVAQSILPSPTETQAPLPTAIPNLSANSPTEAYDYVQRYGTFIADPVNCDIEGKLRYDGNWARFIAENGIAYLAVNMNGYTDKQTDHCARVSLAITKSYPRDFIPLGRNLKLTGYHEPFIEQVQKAVNPPTPQPPQPTPLPQPTPTLKVLEWHIKLTDVMLGSWWGDLVIMPESCSTGTPPNPMKMNAQGAVYWVTVDVPATFAGPCDKVRITTLDGADIVGDVQWMLLKSESFGLEPSGEDKILVGFKNSSSQP